MGTGTLLRTIETGQNPDVAVDRAGTRLILLSTRQEMPRGTLVSSLSFIELPSFAERKRIPVEDRMIFIGSGPSTLLLSVDERLIFIVHAKELGNDSVRVWLTAHDTTSGQQHGRVDLAPCSFSVHLSQGPDPRYLYATCAGVGALHVLRTDPLREETSISIPFNFNRRSPGSTWVAEAAVSPDGSRYVAVTADLRLFLVELPSRKTETITRWGGPDLVRGGMALDSNGSRVWVAVIHPDPAILTMDLASGQLKRTNIPALTSFAMSGDRILYTRGTRLQELAGALNVGLPAAFEGIEGPRVFVTR